MKLDENTFNKWELAIREMLFIKLGRSQRLLWPRLKSEIQRLTNNLTSQEIYYRLTRIQDRHFYLAQHVAPKNIATNILLG